MNFDNMKQGDGIKNDHLYKLYHYKIDSASSGMSFLK